MSDLGQYVFGHEVWRDLPSSVEKHIALHESWHQHKTIHNILNQCPSQDQIETESQDCQRPNRITVQRQPSLSLLSGVLLHRNCLLQPADCGDLSFGNDRQKYLLSHDPLNRSQRIKRTQRRQCFRTCGLLEDAYRGQEQSPTEWLDPQQEILPWEVHESCRQAVDLASQGRVI